MNHKNNNISPHIYVLSTFLTTAGTIAIYNEIGFENHWYLAPLVVLATLYAGINFYRQTRGLSDFETLKNIRWPLLIKKSIVRYFVWLVVVYSANLLYSIYLNLSFLSSNYIQTNFIFFSQLTQLYLIAGLPYFLVTLALKASQKEDFYDPAIRLIHIGKQLSNSLFKENKNKSAHLVLRNKYNRKVLLNLLMRAYFLPIMIFQILGTTLSSLEMINRLHGNDHILNILYFITTFLWLMDIINASLSYSLESRWLENRSRSIDMTFTGWLVCFCCYEPLNQATGYLFPFAPFVATHNPQDLLIPGVNFLISIKVIEILFLVGHIYSDVSLGPSIANITLKRLQTRGPYGLIRHPGTTSKLLMWLSQSIFYKQFWTARIMYGYTMWATIYIGRALTEERHLKKYPEYRKYMEKVKYRFFPWLF